jgi:coenzyme F420 hydrogenase subunit beta
VLDLDEQVWNPILSAAARVEADPTRCAHGERGCTLCTRACPRFRSWETDADLARWSRARTPAEVFGVHRSILLVQATDPRVCEVGQDGGLATALLLYALEKGHIDAALVGRYDEQMRPRPALARTPDEVLAAAGSRYTYSPNTLAFAQVVGAERIGMVGVGCQTSIPAVAAARGARRLADRFALVVGLLCSMTFDDAVFGELLEAKHGIPRTQVRKLNIKGKLQVWHGEPGNPEPALTEIPLAECHQYSRPGCRFCPDFTAEHADISLGGIGKHPRTTLAIVRSELAEGLLSEMEQGERITMRRAAEDDPEAIALITRMATRQRKRWPVPDGSPHQEPGAIPKGP